ncbi:MAG: hypothetical protein ACLR6B_09675 [Blautia sp.]
MLFPEEAAQNNLYYIRKAIRSLKRKNPETALEALYEIDNNAYAFQFSRSVTTSILRIMFSIRKRNGCSGAPAVSSIMKTCMIWWKGF